MHGPLRAACRDGGGAYPIIDSVQYQQAAQAAKDLTLILYRRGSDEKVGSGVEAAAQ
jgi:hypothetical protein